MNIYATDYPVTSSKPFKQDKKVSYDSPGNKYRIETNCNPTIINGKEMYQWRLIVDAETICIHDLIVNFGFEPDIVKAFNAACDCYEKFFHDRPTDLKPEWEEDEA